MENIYITLILSYGMTEDTYETVEMGMKIIGHLNKYWVRLSTNIQLYVNNIWNVRMEWKYGTSM